MHSFLAPSFQDLAAVARQYKQQYAGAAPFPHVYFENFFDPAFLQKVRDEFPDLSTLNTLHFNNPNEIDPALADHSTLFKARAGHQAEVVAPSVRWQDKVKLFIPPILLSWVKK